MSDSSDNQTTHALLCFEPTPALTQPFLAETEPATSPCIDANAETTTPEEMGNIQSGEGSLKRRSKKKPKHKDEKGKIGIASALYKDPVLGASGIGGTSVDEAASPNKRKRQAEQPKSPRPIRSTYDNVNQSGSITSLTSDLFLDTVSRLDVSMTTSQAEIPGIRRHGDPQTFDSISYGGQSLAESGFITPALTTPQVQRNQLADTGATMTTSDSITELGKEIERTIFERLSANQKAGTTEAHSEASISSSPKSNEVKMTLVMRSPIPPRKTVTETRTPAASPLTAKLEIIENDPSSLDSESAEPKPLRPIVESKIELDLRKSQSDRQEDIPKPEISDGTDKADNELMEKECKIDEKRKDPDEETKDKLEELDVNGPNSSSDENCGDFEEVKLHIDEEDLMDRNDLEDKITLTSVKVEASGHPVIGVGQATTITDRNPDYRPTPNVVAAGQQSTLVRQEIPMEEVGEQEIQIKPMEKPQKTEKLTETSADERRRRERPNIEAPKEGDNETTEKSESVFMPQAPRVEGSDVTAPTAATEVAAAAVETKPLESTGRTVVFTKADGKDSLVQSDDNVSVVDTPIAACEELIQATSFVSVEQAHVVMRKPVFKLEEEIQNDQDLIRKRKIDGKIKSGPESNSEPGDIDHKNKEEKDKKSEKPKGKTEEKDQTKTLSSENGQTFSKETDENQTEEEKTEKELSSSELETEKQAVSKSNTDENASAKNMEDSPKEEKTTETPGGEVTEKTPKPKKERKRKRKRGKRQSVDAGGLKTTEAETKETSEREETSSQKEYVTSSSKEYVTSSSKEYVTSSSKEEGAEKNSTDDSGDSSSTAFEKHILEGQTTVIERTGYGKQDGDEHLIGADDKLIDACDLLLQSEEFQNQRFYEKDMPERVDPDRRVAFDTNLTVECPTSSDILSDEPTPTNGLSQTTAFYIPERSRKNKAEVFGEVSDSEKLDETKNDIAEQYKDTDEIKRQEYDEDFSDSESKLKVESKTSEENNNGADESTDNVVRKDSPDGTNKKTEHKRNLRISLTSEEVSDIFENSKSRLNEADNKNRPKIHCHETDNEVCDINNGSDRYDSEASENDSDDGGQQEKRSKNIANLTLSDIDSSLPETLPELADLQNFLEYIKVGEQPNVGDEPPFSPRGETGRSSPNENSNSRRLSRISPAVTERSVTESDLDISEQRDDLSTDSNIFADDEDESSSELLFTKTYTEPDKGGEVCVSCTVVNTNLDEDSDEFWAENSATEEVYQRIETSTKAVTTVFDNARLQMQDIHTHLHNLRLQMESLQESLDNASILSQEYYNMDNDQVTSQEFYSNDTGWLVSQEYFSKSRMAPVTTEEYSPVDIGPVLTEEYYSSALGKPPML